MSIGHQAGYEALAKQARRQKRKLEERLAQRREKMLRTRERLRDSPDEAAEAAEALACPRCHARYAFGGSCPDCDVLLVSASLAERAEPEPTQRPIRWGSVLLQAVGLTIALFAFLALLFELLDHAW